MNTKSLLEGIQILSKYYKDPDGYNCGAEHDQFFMWEPQLEVSEEDVAKLEELGWDLYETGAWMAWL